MGIQTWSKRHQGEHAMTETTQEKPAQLDTTSTAWQTLQDQVRTCAQCDLSQSRTQTVFGVGNPNADLMIIGEAPGANEDLQGEPFVGRAGRLLNEMLKAIDLDRDSIFIANVLKCRPPKNRDPQRSEVNTCTPFLKQQIALIKPKLLVAVGRIAAQFLLDCDTPLKKLRGETHAYENIPLLITYHPAYLLRAPREKAKSYVDFLRIQQAL
jgi:uracil-DNA glycosylase